MDYSKKNAFVVTCRVSQCLAQLSYVIDSGAQLVFHVLVFLFLLLYSRARYQVWECPSLCVTGLLGTTKVVVNTDLSWGFWICWRVAVLEVKIEELFCQHWPRITDTSDPDLVTSKSLLSSAERRIIVLNTDISVSRSQSCNTDLNLLTGETAVWHDTKTSMNLQQPAPLMPPVHPDVQMKPLPFYDVLDVLIKPSSLGLWCFSFSFGLKDNTWAI